MSSAVVIALFTLAAAIPVLLLLAWVALVVVQQQQAALPLADGDAMLRRLGYVPDGGRWVRDVAGVQVGFESDPERGWRWTARLPRSGVSVVAEERGEDWPPAVRRPDEVLLGKPEVDRRLRFLSKEPGPMTELLLAEGVPEALVGVPHVDLQLVDGDLVLRDPARRSLARRGRDPERPDDPRAVAIQERMHEDVARLVAALVRAQGR